jgi:hypothetical protein
MLSVAQWIDNDGNFVSRFQGPLFPSPADQRDRAIHLDSPFHRRRIRFIGVGHEDLNPAVRIGPLEFLHGSDKHHPSVLIEHRPGMVRECRASGQHRNRDDEDACSSLHTVEQILTWLAAPKLSHSGCAGSPYRTTEWLLEYWNRR